MYVLCLPYSLIYSKCSINTLLVFIIISSRSVISSGVIITDTRARVDSWTVFELVDSSSSHLSVSMHALCEPCCHPSLLMSVDLHSGSHHWDLLAYIAGSSVKRLPWHRAAYGVLPCAKGCVLLATCAPRGRSCDSFLSH